jgi:23S rRNA (pseudouridine1915-N3)-methyltransferase
MKFSDIDREQWSRLRPYLDTVLLPISGLSGSEEPWEALLALEELRDLIDAAEGPFRGRVVVYPAFHYLLEGSIEEELQCLCDRLRAIGFLYVIIAARDHLTIASEKDCCDLVLSYPSYKGMKIGGMKEEVHEHIVSMWNRRKSPPNM